TIVPIRMASVRGLLDNLLVLSTSKRVSDIAIAVVSLALVVFAARRWKTASRTDFDLGFALCVIVTVLVSYHTLAYDLSLLLLPLALTIQHFLSGNDAGPGVVPRRARGMILLVLFLLFFSPLHAYLVMRDGHYNLFALVLLFWGWIL